MAAKRDDGGGGGAAGTNVTGVQRVVGFVIVGFVLVLFADFPQTASVAVAFAYLIMVAALMAAGPSAFARVSALVA
jgi:hypothetical protein